MTGFRWVPHVSAAANKFCAERVLLADRRAPHADTAREPARQCVWAVITMNNQRRIWRERSPVEVLRMRVE